MLSKFRLKLVIILIFILFLVTNCNGSGGFPTSYGEIEEEEGRVDENTNFLGGFFEVSEGVTEKG